MNQEPEPKIRTLEGHCQTNPDGSITYIGLREDGTYFQSTSKMVGRIEHSVDLEVTGDVKDAFSTLKAGGKVPVTPKPFEPFQVTLQIK